MIRLKVYNTKSIQTVGNKIELNKQMLGPKTRLAGQYLADAIMEALVWRLGDEANDHFSVTYSDNQYGCSVTVHTDDIGYYIYHGTQPHWIGEDGQILANKPEDFGPVRGPVWHPGTEAWKPEIDADIKDAITKVRAYLGTL